MLITNATLITWESPNRVLENHALLIEGNRIRDIGPSSKLEKLYPKSKKLDARGSDRHAGRNLRSHTFL